MRAGLIAIALSTILIWSCSRRDERRSEGATPTQYSGEAARVEGGNRVVESTPPPAGVATEGFADVVQRVSAAVVTIHSARRVRPPRQFPFGDDPFFRRFFGGPSQERGGRTPMQVGLGSGVIVAREGHILTNHHVVDGAEDIVVELTDRRRLDAQLVGSDPPSDLAVLRVKGAELTVLPLGDSDKVRVGDIALAVGNPLGVGQTVTAGIISAKGRATGLSDGSFEDFLQTDAPINQGNSGGALVNTRSELIGINSQILSPTGANIGIGFAIPSNMARNVMDQLVKGGRVHRGQLGVQVGPVASGRGVAIAGVERGGPADRAGLREGDVVTGFNGQPVADPNELRNRIAQTSPGTEVTLEVVRDGREQQIRVRLGELRSARE